MRETTDVDSTRTPIDGYWVGKECTFHSPPRGDIQCALCPLCGKPLQAVALLAWRKQTFAADEKHQGFAEMMAWSEGRCYPDYDTLQNAYRQAMEGQS